MPCLQYLLHTAVSVIDLWLLKSIYCHCWTVFCLGKYKWNCLQQVTSSGDWSAWAVERFPAPCAAVWITWTPGTACWWKAELANVAHGDRAEDLLVSSHESFIQPVYLGFPHDRSHFPGKGMEFRSCLCTSESRMVLSVIAKHKRKLSTWISKMKCWCLFTSVCLQNVESPRACLGGFEDLLWLLARHVCALQLLTNMNALCVSRADAEIFPKEIKRHLK